MFIVTYQLLYSLREWRHCKPKKLHKVLNLESFLFQPFQANGSGSALTSS